MAVHDRLQVETCQICFDDFEVISVGGPDDDDDAQTVGLEPFFAREDFYDDDELEQLLLALHLSTLDVPEEALTHSPPPLTSKSETPPSRQSPTSQQRGSRPGTTRSSTSTTTSSTTTTQTRSTASSSVSSPPPYTDRESLGLGFSLPCDKEHLFCSNCLNRYIDLKLQSKIWPIVCPNENCKGGIPPAIIESLLGDKSAKWYELSVERAVTNKVYCPNKECNRLLDGDDFDFESDQTKNILNNTTCPHCSVPFCAFCLKAPHGGKSCIRSEGEIKNDQSFKDLVAQRAWKPCPGCGYTVEKSQELLKIPESATPEEIREAYKREALRTHPDRTTNIGGPDGECPLSHDEATARFQQVADAYYVLSDPHRRKQYDNARKSHNRASRTAWESTSNQHAEPNTVFGNVFEELLRTEVENPSTFYSSVGMVSGAALGFICGGLPGAVMGGYGGRTLGHIRDRKGVSVMEAFGRLEHAHKAAIIAAIAAKIFKTLH